MQSAAQPSKALFLEHRSYRRRRLMDVAKLLPILGSVLFLVPLFWLLGGASADPVPTSRAVIYIFVVWALLICVNALFGVAVRRWAESWVTTPQSPKNTADEEHG
ncbi:hypothetical protein K3727_07510 [Rhodobacteraceae bacterium M382]|nr:hypothetical protein K3727_07510 [Rhodobacteraceae bacterium M382]